MNSTASTNKTAAPVWPAEKVSMRAASALAPYARNPRTHSEEQVEQIARSIQEFGWTVPVIVDEKGELIAGHGRILAAQKLGVEKVPTIVAKGWSDEKKRAYRIADNQLTILGGWDDAALAEELAALAASEFDLSLTALGGEEIDRLLEVPEPAEIGPPEDFPSYDESIPTEHRCPKCGYSWSGKPA